MEGSRRSSTAATPPPFLMKTYEMVDDGSTDSIVSWSQDGRSFVVWEPLVLCRDLLPGYFKHNNFSSFIRQLNTYGFRKIDPDQWEFGNEEFVRGQRHRLNNISRRKPIHSHSSTHTPGNTLGPLTVTEKQEFTKEIESLQKDKSLLQLQLRRHKQEFKGFRIQEEALLARLQKMEQRDRHMLSFDQFVSTHGYIQPSENHSKRRRLLPLEPSCISYECDYGDIQKQDVGSVLALCWRLIAKIESSLNFWEDVVLAGVGQGEEGKCDPSSGTVMDMGFGSGVYNAISNENVQPCSPDSSSHPVSLLIDPGHLDSPTISQVFLSEDTLAIKSLDSVALDTLEVEVLKEGVTRMEPVSSGVPTGANDVFWEQFLTE